MVDIGMAWFVGTAFVLMIVYAAAFVLTAYDRVSPRPHRDPGPPAIAQHPQFRTLRWFLLPVLVPIWAFAFSVWFIVYLPVILWRRTTIIAFRLMAFLQHAS